MIIVINQLTNKTMENEKNEEIKEEEKPKMVEVKATDFMRSMGIEVVEFKINQ